MEEGVISPDRLPVLTLAYIGDAVFEMKARLYAVAHGSVRVEKIHRQVTEIVNAGNQSKLSYILLPKLNEEETAVFKRGRNAKSGTSAKHQSISDYRRATGLEALFGWLYLNGAEERIDELFLYGISELSKTTYR